MVCARVQKVCREKEEKMVAHDVLRLQLKRLQDILSLRAGERAHSGPARFKRVLPRAGALRLG